MREEGYDGINPFPHEVACLDRISDDKDHDNNYNNPPQDFCQQPYTSLVQRPTRSLRCPPSSRLQVWPADGFQVSA